MGSFLSRAALTRSEASVYSAAIICGTGGTDMPTGAGKCLADLLAAIFGERHRSKLLKSIAFAGYNKRFEKGCDENAWLTRDTSVVAAYREDPLCGFVFTASAYRDLFTLLGRVSRKEWAQMLPKDLPLLLISGEEDPVGGFGKGVQKIADRLTGAGMTAISLKLYPGMRHEILNEIDKQSVWADILTFVNEVSTIR
jgi:alpha-beta hydrolase superfamily lysophospholipase